MKNQKIELQQTQQTDLLAEGAKIQQRCRIPVGDPRLLDGRKKERNDDAGGQGDRHRIEETHFPVIHPEKGDARQEEPAGAVEQIQVLLPERQVKVTANQNGGKNGNDWKGQRDEHPRRGRVGKKGSKRQSGLEDSISADYPQHHQPSLRPVFERQVKERKQGDRHGQKRRVPSR